MPSAPGMAGRGDAVQHVVADVEMLPANGVVQRVCAGIAPMAVEIVLAEGRACAAKLVQLVGGEDRDLRRQHLGLGDRGGGRRNAFVGGVLDYVVDGERGPFQYG